MVLTGNALQMGGDSGSRTLTTELTADRPDPENRGFKHPDILGWCDRTRTLGSSRRHSPYCSATRLCGAEPRQDRDPVQGLVRAGRLGGRARGRPRRHAGADGRPVRPERGRGRHRRRARRTAGPAAAACPKRESTIEALTTKLNSQNALDPDTLNGLSSTPSTASGGSRCGPSRRGPSARCCSGMSGACRSRTRTARSGPSRRRSGSAAGTRCWVIANGAVGGRV